MMNSQSTETKPSAANGQALNVVKLYRQGVIAGTLGAATIALWFLLLDLLEGHPLYTPHALGSALFFGVDELLVSEPSQVSLGIVAAFTLIHWFVFAVIGCVASRLLDAAERNPNLGFGILLLFVLFEFGFVAAAFVFAEPVLRTLAWQAVLVGNLLAAIVMGAYLWRRHRHLVIYP
jgi:hypothetical protein